MIWKRIQRAWESWRFIWGFADHVTVDSYMRLAPTNEPPYTPVELALDYADLKSYAAVWKKHRGTYKGQWNWDAFIDCQAGMMDELAGKIENG